MNHPGIILAIVWLLVLGSSPALLQWKNQVALSTADAYVCPPCGCRGHNHEVTYTAPGQCEYCEMPLIEKEYPKISWIEWVFRSESRFAIFYHKLFYPAYFLAIFLSFLSVRKYKRDPQFLFFLFFFLGHVLYAFKSQLGGTGHSMLAPARWFFFPLTFLLAIGPALFFYIRHYKEKGWGFSKRDALHFLPAVLIVLTNTSFFLGPERWRALALYNGFDTFPGLSEQMLFPISAVFYGLLAQKVIRKKWGADPKAKKWLYSLLGIHFLFVGLWVFMMLANFSLYNWMSTSLDYHWIWLTVAFFSLIGSYLIIFQRELIFPSQKAKETRLADDRVQFLKARLEHLMQEEQPYLDADLSLQSLSQLLEIKDRELSELLNGGMKTSFYNYVNQYRLEEVKKRLLDPSKQHLTNYGIAQEAGFSSKSTFFNLFKKHMGMTPGTYKKKYREGVEANGVPPRGMGRK